MNHLRARGALPAAALLAATGCTFLSDATALLTDSFDTNRFSGDPFPILVDTSTGAVRVGVREGDAPARTVALDVLAPVTVLDPGPGAPPSVRYADLLVLGARGPGGALDLPRARLASQQVLAVHPCAAASCVIGGGELPTAPIDGVIGADAVAGDALRLRLGAGEVFLLPDVAGDAVARTLACDAVFPTPFAGGGTMQVGGAELDFGGRRIALGACLSPVTSLDGTPQAARGTDALLVASTGVGPTLLSEAAYARYRGGHPAAPPVAALPTATVVLASGPVDGRRTTLDALALAPLAGTSAPRAPCREVYASHLLTERDCVEGVDDCPCAAGVVCGAPAVVELAPAGGLEVLVVPDDDPTLQGLRAELRPGEPEVDGVLGARALAALELDVDYPNNRLLGRCPEPGAAGCVARPALATTASRAAVRRCLP